MRDVLGLGVVFVTHADISTDTLSTIDVKSRTKDPTDIRGATVPYFMAFTPDGKTDFVPNFGRDTVSTIDMNSRTKNPTDIPVGSNPAWVAITPCRR